MIPCSIGQEPDYFDVQVRQPGLKWLVDNPKPATKTPGNRWRPYAFWSVCHADLATEFKDLCAYGAMYEPRGTVDHFVSCDQDEKLAYEWDNYRYCTQWINSSKQNAEVLDPCEVQDGWFKIILPSLQLVLGDEIPSDKRQLAEYTLERLHLDHDERVIRQRREWYRMYQDGELSIEGLKKKAPLIAAAVETGDSVSAGPTV